MLTHTPEAAQAIEGRYREFAHKLLVDWNNNGLYDHPLTDMSRFVTRTSRDQALASTAPEEIKLVEGHAAAELEVEMAGEYDGIPLSGHFAPYNSRSVFYQQGIQLGVEVKYWIGVATDEGWEWFPQFVGIVREVNTDRATGRVVLTCLDNAEKMRTPVLIPPYAVYQNYLQDGYKRSGLVDSTSVIDLACRTAGFSNSPEGYWYQHKTYKDNNGLYGKKIVLSVPFHGSMLPEIGALDNVFEFHKTESWINGTADERARAEQYRDGPQFVSGVPPYLALNAVPKGKTTEAIKKYWMETHDYVTPSGAWGTTVMGTWIYWTGQSQDADSRVITVEYYNVAVDLNVRSSDRGVYPILRYGKTSPGDVYDGFYTGPLLRLPEQPGWYYIEAAIHLDQNLPTLMRTRINETVSNAITVPYVHRGGSEYALAGLVTIENKYALSDLVILRNKFREFITYNDPYIFEPRGNIKAIGHIDPGTPATNSRWGKNRFMYTLRDDTKEAWDIVKEVAAAEYGVVFFDEEGNFQFWNYDTVDQKQHEDPVRLFTLDQVENFSLRLTMDSLRNVWRVTTKTAEAAPGVAYDLARDGVPRQENDTTLPVRFIIPNGTYFGFMIPDNDHVISIHPYLTLRPENVPFDEYAPWEGYKTYQSTSYTGQEILFWPRKSGPYWTKVICYNGSSGPQGFVGLNNRAFFRIQGTLIKENEERSWEVRNENSVAEYGERALEMSGNFWLQDEFQTRAMLSKLVSKLGRPIPVTDAITVPGDPRIQLGDVIEIDDPDGFGGSMKLQVLGITRELEDGIGLVDTYQVEVVENPGQWILGHPDYSVLGQSTILSV